MNTFAIKSSLLISAIMLTLSANAELVQQFKNPSFNGIGWSSHTLTIDSIEKSRKDAIESKRQAEINKSEAALLNTPLNRFMSLFQSQVYAQLATQLSNNLFKNQCKDSEGIAIPGCVDPTTGVFTLDKSVVTWEKISSNGAASVKLTVVDPVTGTTEVTIPIASFAF